MLPSNAFNGFSTPSVQHERIDNAPFTYQLLDKSIVFDFYKGFQDKRELYLYLLNHQELTNQGFGLSASSLIEKATRTSTGEFCDETFIFNRKRFINEKDIPKIYEVLTENKFELDFVKNATKDSSSKVGNNYHSLLIKYSENNMPKSVVVIKSVYDETAGYDFMVSYIGDVKTGLEVEKLLGKFVKERKYQPTFRLVKSIYNYGRGPEVNFRDEVLKPDAEIALPSFYPWLKSDFDTFAKEYIDSTSPVMLLYGYTGTGKTTLARTLGKSLNAVIVATADTAVATNPELFEAYKDMIATARASGDKRPYILLIEDVDKLLMSRLSGNREMSRLLNDTKGISPNKDIKIIFTSNLSKLEDVDPALIRPGRCFAKINLPRLSIEQAKKVREDLKLDNIDLTPLATDGHISLAETIEEHKIKDMVDSGIFIEETPYDSNSVKKTMFANNKTDVEVTKF